MRDSSRNLDHILISRTDGDLIPAFTIGKTEFLIYPKVPAQAIVKLTTAENTVAGMTEYVRTCLAKEEHRKEFDDLMSKIDIEGLGTIIEEIVAKTTPFDSTKPSD